MERHGGIWTSSARRHTGAMRDTRRARIILLAADGLKNQEIAKTLGEPAVMPLENGDGALLKKEFLFLSMMIRGLAGHAFMERMKIEEIVKKTIDVQAIRTVPIGARDRWPRYSWRRQDNRR